MSLGGSAGSPPVRRSDTNRNRPLAFDKADSIQKRARSLAQPAVRQPGRPGPPRYCHRQGFDVVMQGGRSASPHAPFPALDLDTAAPTCVRKGRIFRGPAPRAPTGHKDYEVSHRSVFRRLKPDCARIPERVRTCGPSYRDCRPEPGLHLPVQPLDEKGDGARRAGSIQ